MASNKYRDDPFWYINPKYVKDSYIRGKIFKKALSDASKENVIRSL